MAFQPIDITLPLRETTTTWPGDKAFCQSWTQRIQTGSTVNLSQICLSPHVGTHVDAPYHYDSAGLTIEQLSWEPLIGHCQVVTLGLSAEQRAITADELKKALKNVRRPLPPRLLTQTGYRHDEPFQRGFRHPTPEAIDWAAAHDIQLWGTDAPSVDTYLSKTLPAHRRLQHHGIIILENLDLSNCSPGRYQLYALPLNTVGAEAAPVRAILLPSTQMSTETANSPPFSPPDNAE